LKVTPDHRRLTINLATSSRLSAHDRVHRDEIYAEKNWHDYEDRVRALRTERYKYIRNDYHDLTATPTADAGRSPSIAAIRALHGKGMIRSGRMGEDSRADILSARLFMAKK